MGRDNLRAPAGGVVDVERLHTGDSIDGVAHTRPSHLEVPIEPALRLPSFGSGGNEPDVAASPDAGAWLLCIVSNIARSPLPREVVAWNASVGKAAHARHGAK